MGGLRIFLAAISMLQVVGGSAARAQDGANRLIARWQAPIREASLRFAIPESWIRRVMRAESGGRTERDGRPITSRAGAMGLMQVMPGTWAELRLRHKLGPDPHNPRDNILAGTAYLRAMYDRFGYPGLFAAYNAGPARFERHRRTGAPLPSETIAYAAQVSGGYQMARERLRVSHGSRVPRAVRSSGLFAVRAVDATPLASKSASLFVIRLRRAAEETAPTDAQP